MGHASYGNNSDQDPASEKPNPSAAERKVEGGSDRSGAHHGGEAAPELPAGGPHADEDLTNDAATPGAGTLPEAGDKDATDSTSG